MRCNILVWDLEIHHIKTKYMEKQKTWYKIIRHTCLYIQFFEIKNRGLKITLNASLVKARVKYCPCLLTLI